MVAYREFRGVAHRPTAEVAVEVAACPVASLGRSSLVVCLAVCLAVVCLAVCLVVFPVSRQRVALAVCLCPVALDDAQNDDA